MSAGTAIDHETLSLDDLIDAIAAHERAGAAIALAAARLDRDGGWAASGAVSMKAWMRDHCRLSNTHAGRWLRRGRFLHTFDAIADAAVDSTLASGHVDALQAAVTAETEPVMIDGQAGLVEALAPLPIRDAEQICTLWRQRAEALCVGQEPKPERRDLSYATAGDGAVVGRFELDGALGAEFTKAIDTALTYNEAEEFRLPGHQRADALFEICAFFNANHDRPGTPRHRPHLELLMSVEHLDDFCSAETIDGAIIPTGPTDAFLCDSIIHRVVHADSAVVDYGRATRVVALDLFRAVAARDRGCRFPGCDRPVRWCEAHHIQHWRHGGPTSLDNLALVCTRHHHLIHTPGWHAKLLPDATFEITTPTGLTRTSRPPGSVTAR